MIENDGSVVAALSVFLLARNAEREAEARGAVFEEMGVTAAMRDATAGMLGYLSPARVLAECAAQRAIIEGDYWERNDGYVGIEVIEDVFRFLALPDADHPDYRDEWKPWT